MFLAALSCEESSNLVLAVYTEVVNVNSVAKSAEIGINFKE